MSKIKILIFFFLFSVKGYNQNTKEDILKDISINFIDSTWKSYRLFEKCTKFTLYKEELYNEEISQLSSVKHFLDFIS